MKRFRILTLALSFAFTLAVFGSGCSPTAEAPALEQAQAAPLVNQDPAPPMPEGFTSSEEAVAAVVSGKVPTVDTSMPAPPGVKEVMDIEYGKVGDVSLKLDLALPENATEPVPGLVFMVGGGWKYCSREDYYYYTRSFAKEGYAAATVTYRVVDQAKFPGCVEDAKCAVRWMRKNAAQYNIDPDRIAVIGGSAGGYLSMMVGYSSDVPELEGDGGNDGVSSAVQAVVNFYGPTDLTAEMAQDAPQVLDFLGKTYAEDPRVFSLASPLHHLTKDDPPTLILHGSVDAVVPLSQADALAERLRELGVPYEYEVFTGWPHTMDMAKSVNDRCRWLMSRFFEKHLAKKS